jgi:pyruvate carboxylase
VVSEVVAKVGQEVKQGDKLVTLEAMKMLTTISAGLDGVVKEVLVKKGDQVESDDLLVKIEATA